MTRNVKPVLLFVSIVAVFLAPPARGASPEQSNKYIAIYVADMHCAHCAKKVSSKLYTVKGVLKVQTNLQKNLALVVPATGRTISPRVLWEAIESVKLKPVKIVMRGKTYTQKPPKQVSSAVSSTGS